MGVEITSHGDWKHLEAFLNDVKDADIFSTLGNYGQLGVEALSNATPIGSGETAQSWFYRIVQRKGYFSIRWYNGHIVDGVPIAVILQYGHGTGTGGYVQGRNYIMPAIQPIFDVIEKEVSAILSEH